VFGYTISPSKAIPLANNGAGKNIKKNKKKNHKKKKKNYKKKKK
jgi:hypothetical protein